MKQPRYWWDFVDGATAIHVQSDMAKYPVLARIGIPGDDATAQIKMAEMLIARLTTGALTPKRCVEVYRYGADRIG